MSSDWRGINEFVQVVESGSFTRAAQSLHLSKSYISRTISDLEERLGVQLLFRNTRRLSLTAAGEKFYQRCSQMRGIFSEAENAGVGFGLGFAVTEHPAQTLTPGSVGDYYWGGMFSTGFFVDPVEEICMVFMTQLMPSSTYPVRREVKTMVHAAIDD